MWLQRAQGCHRFDWLARDCGDVLEVPVVVEHGQLGALGDCRQHQIGATHRTMTAAVCQEQHHLGCPIEVRLVCRDGGKRPDQLFMHPARVPSTEKGFELEHAASGEPILILQL